MPQYIDLRGHQIYSYEWDNDGEAVVLLHGGLSKTSSLDYILVPAVEDDFHVFAYDRTGQGFTADQEGSLHFDFQTDEAIAYLEDVVKEPAHLIGYSDGAIIALMVAIKRPDLVKSIISIG
ncbi:MAG: alpha/beta fold hydrolase, partial [Actinobacteria bacterium]|nr:alpha/beta fold hydrolase [Actinomycetota bacterium]